MATTTNTNTTENTNTTLRAKELALEAYTLTDEYLSRRIELDEHYRRVSAIWAEAERLGCVAEVSAEVDTLYQQAALEACLR